MHLWHDDWFEKYGNDLNDAVNYIGGNCRKWGRIGGDYKEKYGTVRFYAHFHYQLHDLFWPGYCRIMWGRFLNRLDLWFSRTSFYRRIKPLIWKYQAYVYRTVYLKAIARWPHLKAEIIRSADHKELFPLALCREAHDGWLRSAVPGDIVHYSPAGSNHYGPPRAVVYVDDNYIYLACDYGYTYEVRKRDFKFWDGCGIS